MASPQTECILRPTCAITTRSHEQSCRSQKVVAIFSATNFSSHVIELLPLHDTIQIKLNYAWINHNRAIRWWRHQMETFSALLVICAGNSPVPDEFPAQRPVTRSFVVFFDLRLNKRLSKQSQGWWFETPPWSLWRQCKEKSLNDIQMCKI